MIRRKHKVGLLFAATALLLSVVVGFPIQTKADLQNPVPENGEWVYSLNYLQQKQQPAFIDGQQDF